MDDELRTLIKLGRTKPWLSIRRIEDSLRNASKAPRPRCPRPPLVRVLVDDEPQIQLCREHLIEWMSATKYLGARRCIDTPVADTPCQGEAK